jgi:hypothetical protein
MKTYAFLFVIVLTFFGCATIPDEPKLAETTGYQVIMWSTASYIPAYADFYTPVVWFEGYDKYSDFRDSHDLDSFDEMGTTPLLWRNGRNVVEQISDAEELSAYWADYADDPGIPIGIDEFGHTTREADSILAEALLLTDENYPDLPVYVWHAGQLNSHYIRAYRDSSAYVLLELYTSDVNFMPASLGSRLSRARRNGFSDRVFVALGIQDTGEGAPLWSYNAEILRTQIRWCLENYPEIAGFAFFAPRASTGLLDELGKILREEL